MKILAPMRSIISRLALLMVVGLAFTLSATSFANGANFFCSSGNVTCLIVAINKANALPGQHTINLQPGTYTLTTVDNNTDDPNGLPSVTGSIAIRQNNHSAVIERDPAAPEFRLFHVAPSGNLKLYGLDLRNGFNGPSQSDEISLGGGAIYNRGNLFLEQLAIYDNTTGFFTNFGGAIRNDGHATIVDTELHSNVGNFHQGIGGAAIGNHGELTVIRGLIRSNFGDDQGGISSDGQLMLSDSALIENTSAFGVSGGLLSLSGTATIVNTTIARNTSEGPGDLGGGIAVLGGLVTFVNSTIVENRKIDEPGSGGGIVNKGGTVRLQNTILALNLSETGFDGQTNLDCTGPITSLGNNIIGTTSGCTINLQATDIVGDPQLDNADTYYRPRPGSPAIDAANPQACPATDQLGFGRVEICDIGAVEFQTGIGVAIDIEPKDENNSVRLKGNGTMSVAILGAQNFDVAGVDPSTVKFGPNQASAVRTNSVRPRDVNGDGNPDLVLVFKTKQTGVSCDDTSTFLSGQTVKGQRIFGSDSINPICTTLVKSAFTSN